MRFVMTGRFRDKEQESPVVLRAWALIPLFRVRRKVWAFCLKQTSEAACQPGFSFHFSTLYVAKLK